MKTLILILLIPFYIFGQTLDKQLLPRNASDFCTITASYDSVHIFKDGVLTDTIFAELANYDIILFNGGVPDTLFDIVCGDVYIINGQSNAEARMRDVTGVADSSYFIRVYAYATDTAANLQATNQWFIGQGDGNRESLGNTGQWGLHFAKMIIDSFGIPVAIFNGAKGGADIDYFLPNDSLTYNYGRLKYRLDTTGLTNSVKAVLWSQGENDAIAETTTADYTTDLLALRTAWLSDYPGIEKIIILQTSYSACGASALGDSYVCAAQYKFGKDYENVETISTTYITKWSDGCHYPYAGYKLFAEKVYNKLFILSNYSGWSVE